jgi:pentatricopeptide repeat protein
VVGELSQVDAATPPEADEPDHYAEAMRRFRGDVRMMEQVLATMIERGEPRREIHLALMLDEYLAARSLRKARAIIDQLDELGVRIDARRQYDVAIATAASGDQAGAMVIVDRLLGEQRDPGPTQATVVLSLLVGARRTPEAWSLYRRMRSRDQHATRDVHGVLLSDALERRAAKDSLTVVRGMIAAGHEVSRSRGAALARMLVGIGQIDRALELLDLLTEAARTGHGPMPDDDTHAAVVAALATKGRVEEVAALVARATPAEASPSSLLRNTLLQARIAAADFDGAWTDAEAMWADACLPTGTNLESLLDLTLANGNVARAAGLLDLLLVIGAPVTPQRSGAVLRAELADGGLERVLPVADTILVQGLTFDRATARDLVERLVRARRLDEARAWLERFRVAGTLTQGRSWSSLLVALVAAKRLDDAIAVLEGMLAARVQPMASDVSKLVAGRLKADDAVGAERILLAASAGGVHVDEATLRELMWLHARRSDVAAVDRIIALLVASGVTPDERHEKARAWASGETPRRLEDTQPDAAASAPEASAPEVSAPEASAPEVSADEPAPAPLPDAPAPAPGSDGGS